MDRDTRSIDQIMSSIDSHSRIDITRSFPSARVEIGASQIAEVSRIANSPSLFQNNHYSTSNNSSFQSSHFGQIQTAQSIMPDLEINSSQTFDSTDPGERIKQAILKAQESGKDNTLDFHDHTKVSQEVREEMREMRAFFDSEMKKMKREMESLSQDRASQVLDKARISQAREAAEKEKSSFDCKMEGTSLIFTRMGQVGFAGAVAGAQSGLPQNALAGGVLGVFTGAVVGGWNANEHIKKCEADLPNPAQKPK
jgi:hypothetical protein